MAKVRAGAFDIEVARQAKLARVGAQVEQSGKAAWKSCPDCAGRYRAGQKLGHVAAGHADWFESK
jgi:hypothetical protein